MSFFGNNSGEITLLIPSMHENFNLSFCCVHIYCICNTQAMAHFDQSTIFVSGALSTRDGTMSRVALNELFG